MRSTELISSTGTIKIDKSIESDVISNNRCSCLLYSVQVKKKMYIRKLNLCSALDLLYNTIQRRP